MVIAQIESQIQAKDFDVTGFIMGKLEKFDEKKNRLREPKVFLNAELMKESVVDCIDFLIFSIGDTIFEAGKEAENAYLIHGCVYSVLCVVLCFICIFAVVT